MNNNLLRQDIIIFTRYNLEVRYMPNGEQYITLILYFVNDAFQQKLPFQFQIGEKIIISQDVINAVYDLHLFGNYYRSKIQEAEIRLPWKLRKAIIRACEYVNYRYINGMNYISIMVWIMRRDKITSKERCIKKFKEYIPSVLDSIAEVTFEQANKFLKTIKEHKNSL